MATRVRVRARHGRGVDKGTHSTQADALNPTRDETRGASHVKTKAARRGVRACGSARGRGRCGCRGACSSSSPQSARHTNGAGTSICVSCREPSCVVVEGGRKGFPRFCFAVCPLPPTYVASVLMVARSTLPTLRQGGRVCESFCSDILAGSPVGRVETLGGRGRDGPRRPRAQHDLWTRHAKFESSGWRT